jgi:DNA-binding NarL/FixJ family response regulator
MDVIDLVRVESVLASDGHPLVVAVLVEPSSDDWRCAQMLEARVVVVLDLPASDERTIQLMLAGADAVLHAGVEVDRLLAAVRVVGIGNPFLGASQARVVVDCLRAGNVAGDTTPTLTRREAEILLSIERGESTRETATGLGISLKTVQNLQSRLFRKLGAKNRPQAIARAYELGVVEGSAR